MSYNKWEPNCLALPKKEMDKYYHAISQMLVSQGCWFAHSIMTDESKKILNSLVVHIIDEAIDRNCKASTKKN